MNLKRYKEKKFINYFTISLVLIIISLGSAIFIINYFANRIDSILMPKAEALAQRYVATIINNSTDDILFEKDLFVINKDENNEIKMITYNSLEVTKLTNEITHNIQDNFLKLENEDTNNSGIVFTEVPFGIIFDNAFLRNIGPKIKIRIDIISNILSELQTEIKPYGINNALVEVSVHLEATARIVMPFSSKDIKMTNVIPISINVVNGSIPEAYISSYK